MVQGGLGALTVLALLPSAVVTAHLATALLLVGLLSATSQQLLGLKAQLHERTRPWLWIALAATSLLAVLGQCLVGGAMASQWAAKECLTAGIGCQWLNAHRHLGSIVAACVSLQAALALRQPLQPVVRGLSLAALALVLVQLGLGLGSWQLQLHAPMITVAHQVVASLLVAVLAAGLSREVAHG
jgi:cytochrome c oxidase assembly protein subunit 15